MQNRLLMVIHWVSLAGLIWGLLLWYDEGIYKDSPMRKSDFQMIAPFVGQYLVYVIFLWVIKSRWIFFPWQLNRDKRGESER